jgi:type VI secretion system protein ImpJ
MRTRPRPAGAIITETVSDSASGSRIEQVLELAVPRLELAVRKTPRPGYQNLRLARISEVRDGVVTLDETFPPPALVIGAHPQILGYLTRVIGWIEARLESLARYAADPSAGGGMQASDYLMLMVLNRQIGVLRHLSRTFAVHPEALYRELIALAGELTTFDSGNRMRRIIRPMTMKTPRTALPRSWPTSSASCRAMSAGRSACRCGRCARTRIWPRSPTATCSARPPSSSRWKAPSP